MKLKSIVPGLILFIVAAGSAQAEFFLGASVSNTSYGYDDIGNSNGSKAFAGYRFDNGVYLEAAYQDMGSAEVDDTDFELQYSGASAFIGYDYFQNKVGFFGKVGMYSLDTELSVGGASISESSSGGALGFGLRYAFTPHFGIRGEIEMFFGPEDFADDETVSGGSLGLEARF